MPKIKTHRGAAKRFNVTGTGKIKCKRAGKSHLLTHKTTKRKRNMRRTAILAHGDKKLVQQMMPYGG